ncbi:MAG: beta-ketoacyl synthase, partial [Deltaproteobacteria bacterium]|nr:beta-ketoacyl synthase [Deltaproteobacteria bacterium]
MEQTAHRAIAIVGLGAILPDAPDITTFWDNVKHSHYSISDVTPDRWDPNLYYDPDPKAPDKTYSKIGGWVRGWEWNPFKWGLAIPPRVSDAMDDAQKWAVACTHAALLDYGYPRRPLDPDRTAVILGNALGGERHYLTCLRIYFPEYACELAAAPSFAALPPPVQAAITNELRSRIGERFPEISEDTMPGELSNCIAGRIANLFNFRGPNYVVDAACASAMAAISAATAGLIAGDYGAVLAGGVDRNMGASTYVKFCKIGALSATGTRPYADGADGFVMGEGAAVFLLRRLADAERDGDRIYAVLRGVGGSSDGKGKGITAPNPIGQRLAVQRAWQNAGLSLATATLVEGHGTSTRVGDVVEVQSLMEVFDGTGMAPGSIALGSVKSNIGHLKGAAGAAGLLKTVLALHEKVLPPSLHFEKPNPDIDFAHCPFFVNTKLQPWPTPAPGVRRAGVSAFGFGGTNFHLVLEEHVPERLTKTAGAPHSVAVPSCPAAPSAKAPLRGALVIGAASEQALVERLTAIQREATSGRAPASAVPAESDLSSPERIAIDYADAADLADKAAKALKALGARSASMWKALRAQGIFRGSGPAPKVAFLFTGQGSQYVNMLHQLRAVEPIVAQTFVEADRVMTPLLGQPLSDYIFVDSSDAATVAKAEDDLRQTAITQPAVLTVDAALTRLLRAYGIAPNMVMGHSLGEYGALVAADALPFEDALEAVSARGREMTNVSFADNGWMAAVFAPLTEIERILRTIDGYVVIANVNSNRQSVIGGATTAVQHAIKAFAAAGYEVVQLQVSHAFHTSIVAPASEPLRCTLARLRLGSPAIPIVANVHGEFYPTGPGVVPAMLDILAQQVASPVQFVKGLHTLYDAGARLFVEVGPKKALQGFAEDVFANREDVASLFTNHPKLGDIVAFNQALCGLYAAGLGLGERARRAVTVEAQAGAAVLPETVWPVQEQPRMAFAPLLAPPPEDRRTATGPTASLSNDRHLELGRLFAEFLERGRQIYFGDDSPAAAEPVVITGAALGLPGTDRVFDDANVGRILDGEQFIDTVPTRFRHAMLDKHITRLVKREDGGPTFEAIASTADVIKLAARRGHFDLAEEFGVSAERILALDIVTALAIGAGLDALRDAGIPLVMRYKTTSKGTQLPERWGLPDSLRDSTGVIFCSAFPGYDAFAADLAHYYADRARRQQVATLEHLRSRLSPAGDGHDVARAEIDHLIHELHTAIEKEPFTFDRRFLFRILAMGHSQFAELIGARGPNTQINAACASSTQAVSLAEDWIRAGRCRRVIIIAADDVTSDNLLEWMGAGFLITGAAATDEVVEDAAIPFDRRRHGMILGMGAAAMVVESAEAARERGVQPICEVLSAVTANSAFHGTRLDVDHICQVMETLVAQAEGRWGVQRQQMASQTVFVSHETYTPARGGSAAAEVHALRHVFGAATDEIVVANTKGFTGHPMGVGIEDVVAIKALETGLVPRVANFKEVDPELGPLNLSKGGTYPVQYALRLGAGFGSQISMTLMRWVPTPDRVRRSPDALGYAYRIVNSAAWTAWLSHVSGSPTPELEVVQRTLRMKDQGPAARVIKTEMPASAPAVAARAPAQPRLAPAAPGDPVKARVLALFAEKTGYPPDMLAPDLDLEADLGIDTVKQAELFATIRAAYNIPRDDKLKLRDFPTLAHVIQFVRDRRPDLAAAATTAGVTPQATPSQSPVSAVAASDSVVPSPPPGGDGKASDLVRERVMALFAEKTGYPVDMLDPDLDLEADLGIDTVKQAELFATIRAAYNIPRDDKLKLRDFPTLAHVMQFVRDRRPDLAAVAPATQCVTAQPASPQPPVPAVAAPDLAATTPPVGGDGQASDPVRERIMALFAEKTGYPPDMLDPELDLEADLGIDTVKQAELFATIRTAYNIPRDDKLKLRNFPTLAHVMQFVRDRRPDLGIGGTEPPETRRDAQTVAGDRPQTYSFAAADLVPRRVPVPALRPPLSMCKPTGVKLGAGSRVVVMADQGGVAKALLDRLQKLGAGVLSMDPSVDVAACEESVKAWASSGAVHGVYWLPALDHEGDLDAMDLTAWRSALRVRLKLLYSTMRALYDHIAAPGTFLLSATRLGGQHGYDAAGAWAPVGGAVLGFTKAYKRERSEALVKGVDFEPERKAAEVADLLIAETLRDPGAVEIGYKAGERWTVGLSEQSAADGHPGLPLTKDTVFVVTGAAGSIVSAIVADLAAACGGTFYLLDLAPEPDPANPDLHRFVSDKEGLKRDLFERIKARGERATPARVDKELAALERAQAALSAIQTVQRSGGSVRYHQADLRDAEAVARAIAAVRQQSGRIDVLLHAAGLEVSRFLPDKEPAEFDLVFDVKSDGWFNLLHAIGDMPLGASVVFSSVAGRFGNGGQTDYSAANDLLCKITSSFRSTRPATRAIAIDWTAWGGIGMATRGSIPTMMAAAGIDMLPPEAGIPVIRRELTAGSTRGEIVVAQRLGMLMNEWDDSGGIDIAAVNANGETKRAGHGPMLGKVVGMGLHSGLTVETILDPAAQPFLHDHQIDGTPVLPGVMGVEAFAELATLPLPSWHVVAVENVDFLAPFKFYRGEPRTLTLNAVFHADGDDMVASCRLTGSRTLPNQPEPQMTTHFTARVRLARRPLTPDTSAVPPPASSTGVRAPDIYRLYFHGPAYQVLDSVWRDHGATVARMATTLPANHHPAELPTIVAPRLIELCFQTAGIWEMGTSGRLALPQHIDRVSTLASAEPVREPLCAVVTAHSDTSGFDARVLDATGTVLVMMQGYRTVEV